jgi:hypothetical protein
MPARESRMTDRNGQLVHKFQLDMQNLGFQRMADEMVSMLRSGVWREWKDGLGNVHLLPGEYDYFLSMCGITRDDVMHGIRDMAIKARLEKAMDERRTGDAKYRRRYEEIKPVLGRRNAKPFGYTKSEHQMMNGKDKRLIPVHRMALGSSVRRYAKTGDGRQPSKKRSKVEQLEASIARLDDKEFVQLSEWLTEHRKQRRRRT